MCVYTYVSGHRIYHRQKPILIQLGIGIMIRTNKNQIFFSYFLLFKACRQVLFKVDKYFSRLDKNTALPLDRFLNSY